MRLDRFLFFTRLVKSRTRSQALIGQGHVRLDGRRVERSSEQVESGSLITVPLHGRTRVLRVLALPSRRGPPAEARSCYAELDGGEPERAAAIDDSAART